MWCPIVIKSGWRGVENRATLCRMSDLLTLVFGLIVDLFRSRAALEAEILVLRQQIIVLRRRKATPLPFTATDRLVLGWACLPAVSEDLRRARHRAARDRCALASGR